jgi:glutamyl/glutaminyl-tRNA synthetase
LSPNLTNEKYYINKKTVKEYFDEIPKTTSEKFHSKVAFFHNIYRTIIPEFDALTLETALKETAKQLGVKAGVLIHPTRLAATGNPHGPSLYHLLEVLGKEKVLARIGRALGNF